MRFAGLLAITWLCSSSCAPASPKTVEGSSSSPNHWAECYRGFSSTGDPKSDLVRLTRACGHLGGMRPISPIRVAHQAATAKSHHYAIPVVGSQCLRIFATADADIVDLDLLLRHTDGEAVAADLTHDSFPVLPPRAPLCLDEPGPYVLEVSVHRGAGYYAVQVWGKS